MSPSECAIRAVTVDDAVALNRLVTEMTGELGGMAKTSTAGHFAGALAAEPPLLAGLIAEREDKAVGICLWFPWFSTWRGEPGLYVQDLYIVPEARRGGLARAMLAQAARHGKAAGAAFLKLGVDRANDKALTFYKKLGFTTADEVMLDLHGTPFGELAGEDNQMEMR